MKKDIFYVKRKLQIQLNYEKRYFLCKKKITNSIII